MGPSLGAMYSKWLAEVGTWEYGPPGFTNIMFHVLNFILSMLANNLGYSVMKRYESRILKSCYQFSCLPVQCCALVCPVFYTYILTNTAVRDCLSDFMGVFFHHQSGGGPLRNRGPGAAAPSAPPPAPLQLWNIFSIQHWSAISSVIVSWKYSQIWVSQAHPISE